MRSQVVESGRMHPNIQAVLESTYLQGNPWSRAREKRYQWAADLNLRVLAPGDYADNLLYICCTSCYDPRCQQVIRSLVSILQQTDVDFGVLGTEETCCCSEQLRMGELGMFEELAKANLDVIRHRRFRRIVTVSPHCLNALRSDYPDLGVPVLHYTQLLAELLEEGRLKIPRTVDFTVTYHDPCYLGRRNRIYDEPRTILTALAGDRFLEFDRRRETSLCCEGGGGRMWTESAGQGRLAETRVLDAIAMSANVIASACPFCLLTLEDAVKTTSSEERVRIRDLAELVAETL